jgi:hypothetical protein
VRAGEQPERHPACLQFVDAVDRPPVRQVVTRIRVRHVPGWRVEHRIQTRDEHLRRHLRAELVVDDREHFAGRSDALRDRADDAPRRSHHQRGRNALVGDVPDHDAEATAVELDEVVEVAADFAGRAVERLRRPSGERRRLFWQEVLLDQTRDPQLLLVALTRADLGLLLADELRDPKGRRRLRCEVVQELAVVRRVLLLRQAGAEVQHADELALAHQRDGQLHAGRAQPIEGLGFEPELVDVDRPRCLLEVHEERIVWVDVEDAVRGRLVDGRAEAIEI